MIVLRMKDPQGVLGKEFFDMPNGISAHEVIFDKFGDIDLSHTMIFLNGRKIEPPKFEDGKLVATGDEYDMLRPLGETDRLALVHVPEGSMFIFAVLAIILAVVVAFLLMPDAPKQNQSSNNAFQGQRNAARIGDAIPDIYGTVKSYPDLAAAESFKVYQNNRAQLKQYLVFGIGEYDVGQLRLGTTPIAAIPGATHTLYEPVNGVTEIPLYEAQYSVPQVEGQEIEGTYDPGKSYDFSARTLASLEGTEAVIFENQDQSVDPPDFSKFLSVGDTLSLVGGAFPEPDLSGDYTVAYVDDWVIRLADAETVNAGWSNVTPNTPYSGSYKNASASGEITIGPFDTGVPGRGFIVDTIFQRGLKRDAKIRIDYEEIDAPGGSPIPGTQGSANLTYSARTFDRQNRSFIYRDPVLKASYYRVSVTRTNKESDDPEKPDMAQWERLASFTEEVDKTFTNNETIVEVTIPETPNAVNPRQNKVNAIVQRKTVSYDTVDQQMITTLAPSNKFADAVLHEFTQVFQRPISDLAVDELYAIQESIDAADPQLGEFSLTFDDKEVGLGERMQAICNTVRARVYMDGGVYRFTRDEKKPYPVGAITMRDIAKERNYTRSWGSRLPNQTDGIRVQYIDPELDKPAYIFKKFNNKGDVINGNPLNPVEIDLIGCRNKAQAENRAILECKRLLKSYWIVQDTVLSQGALYDIGDLVRYADVFREDVVSGEILDIDPSQEIATINENIVMLDDRRYEISYTDQFGNLHGPFTIDQSSSGRTIVVEETAAFADAFAAEDNVTQLGSRFIITEVFDESLKYDDGGLYVVTEKRSTGNGDVELVLTQYIESLYSHDPVAP